MGARMKHRADPELCAQTQPEVSAPASSQVRWSQRWGEAGQQLLTTRRFCNSTVAPESLNAVS